MAEALTFEKVWAALMEDRENLEKLSSEMKETDRRMKETDRIIGDLGNRFGELAEHLVAPNIKEKFIPLGFNFEEVSRDKEISDSSGRFLVEIDILLENDEIVMAVEVKSKPQEKDIFKHIERMEILRRRADQRGDTRKYRGAIAGAIMNSEMRDYIQKNGFYPIEQTGDTVKISITDDFVPREW